MGRKAFDLMAVKAAYGGRVAEVGVVSFLIPLYAIPIKAFFPPQALKV